MRVRRRGGSTYIVPDHIGYFLDEERTENNMRRVRKHCTDHAFICDCEFDGDALTSQVVEICHYSLGERVDGRNKNEDPPLSDILW